jgi:hypothetical protein
MYNNKKMKEAAVGLGGGWPGQAVYLQICAGAPFKLSLSAAAG